MLKLLFLETPKISASRAAGKQMVDGEWKDEEWRSGPQTRSAEAPQIKTCYSPRAQRAERIRRSSQTLTNFITRERIWFHLTLAISDEYSFV